MSAKLAIGIVGASARAAAFSALRAGFSPWCADLFADTDLAARCAVAAIPMSHYPNRFLDFMRHAPPGPWIFTGGLENRPALIARMARERPLWGCPADALRAVRDPANLASVFARFDIPCPAVRLTEPTSFDRRWLAKSRDGSGGSGIAEYRARAATSRRTYFQEFLDGPSVAAVFVGRATGVDLLGVTRQLVGEPWLNAKPFQYCGSLTTDAPPHAAFRHIGEVLARECGLRGLFGVDCILRDGVPWPVEVNPRYTASVEVVEWSSGRAALADHANAFLPEAVPPLREYRPIGRAIGKAILFARRTMEFPAEGPWSLWAPSEVPAFADIPRAGSRIEAGWPILSMFATADTAAACVAELERMAFRLERRFTCE